MTAPVIRSVRCLHHGWGRYLVATVDPGTSAPYDREVEDHGHAAVVLPYDPDRRVALLVDQLRVPVLIGGAAPSLLEAPAGRLDGDDPAACARREAQEEAGLALSHLEPAGVCYAMPGISTERMHLFLAVYRPADRTSAGGGLASENEHITVREIGLRDLAAMVDENRLPDMKTLLLVQTLRLRRPDLFAS